MTALTTARRAIACSSLVTLAFGVLSVAVAAAPTLALALVLLVPWAPPAWASSRPATRCCSCTPRAPCAAASWPVGHRLPGLHADRRAAYRPGSGPLGTRVALAMGGRRRSPRPAGPPSLCGAYAPIQEVGQAIWPRGRAPTGRRRRGAWRSATDSPPEANPPRRWSRPCAGRLRAASRCPRGSYRRPQVAASSR